MGVGEADLAPTSPAQGGGRLQGSILPTSKENNLAAKATSGSRFWSSG